MFDYSRKGGDTAVRANRSQDEDKAAASSKSRTCGKSPPGDTQDTPLFPRGRGVVSVPIMQPGPGVLCVGEVNKKQPLPCPWTGSMQGEQGSLQHRMGTSPLPPLAAEISQAAAAS